MKDPWYFSSHMTIHKSFLAPKCGPLRIEWFIEVPSHNVPCLFGWNEVSKHLQMILSIEFHPNEEIANLWIGRLKDYIELLTTCKQECPGMKKGFLLSLNRTDNK